MSACCVVPVVALGASGIAAATALALVQAIVETGLAYQKQKQFRSDDGKTHAVDLVAQDEEGSQVGIRVDAKKKVLEFIPHDCAGTKGRTLANRIAQRYAYSRATEELRKKGYKVTGEKVLSDGTIEVVAARWK